MPGVLFVYSLITTGRQPESPIDLESIKKNTLEGDTKPRDGKLSFAPPHRHTVNRHTVASDTWLSHTISPRHPSF